MKAISILGASIASLTSLFGSRLGSPNQPLFSRHWRPTGKALRNPADPHQAARIQAAADKRDRKGVKLERDANRSYCKNYAWPADRGFDPLYVNR